jgi:hypothetical protein
MPRPPLVIGLLTAVAVGLIGPAPAGAQPASRWFAAGAVELARTTEDDGFLGSGPGWSAGLGLRLTSKTSVTIEVGGERHVRNLRHGFTVTDATGRLHTLFADTRWDGTGSFAIGAVSRTLGRGRARPVVWGGGGWLWHGGTRYIVVRRDELPPGAEPPGWIYQDTTGRAVNAPVVEGGGGVEFEAGARLAVRPYASLRLIGTDNEGPKYVVRYGMSVRVGF